MKCAVALLPTTPLSRYTSVYRIVSCLSVTAVLYLPWNPVILIKTIEGSVNAFKYLKSGHELFLLNLNEIIK
jgi:hypothetical protein